MMIVIISTRMQGMVRVLLISSGGLWLMGEYRYP